MTAAVIAVGAAAISLALAQILDAPWLRLAAVALILGSLVAREVWLWWGGGRQWLLIYGMTIGGTIALTFMARQIAG